MTIGGPLSQAASALELWKKIEVLATESLKIPVFVEENKAWIQDKMTKARARRISQRTVRSVVVGEMRVAIDGIKGLVNQLLFFELR